MKYLVAIPKERVTDDKWATVREPVVPCFPSQSSGAFLAVPSFRFAEKAEVAETDADPDEMCAALAKEYPGLPESLHANYILNTFKGVRDLPVGSVCHVSVNQNQALLIPEKGGSVMLWSKQPL